MPTASRTPSAGPSQASTRSKFSPAAPSARSAGRCRVLPPFRSPRSDGIVDYQPSELVLTAQAATPLATIEAAVEAERQMLAFEPADYAPLLGATGDPTLGGALACNLSGPAPGSRRAPRAIISSACTR